MIEQKESAYNVMISKTKPFFIGRRLFWPAKRKAPLQMPVIRQPQIPEA
jgi:hypothetical protein